MAAMAAAAINTRLGKAGSARASANGRIEVDIFGKVDERELQQIKRRITTKGTLVFRIVANPKDHAEEIALAKASAATSLEKDGRTAAQWVTLAPENFSEQAAPDHWVTRSDGDGQTEVLVMVDSNDVTGEYLASAKSAVDPEGEPAMTLTFNTTGARRFGRLIAENQPDDEKSVPRHLGVLLDDTLFAALPIHDATTENVQVTGNFTARDVETMVAILRAGSLPCKIRQVSEQPVGK
ncbi:hypothetical protein NG895_16775 [Aeoliella sp. ICT_H6.2]|uniref:SecDF P1 head subdomain domain-containing protein n=1 Tax=Aeoliella straminimaris TaxID=2954799 RepID=A0A9X2JIC1_9BACT|nr:hypothetical protein [Aeoliella straminimaris]MCO6045568.1 hypothetical protein [Aeoliella straminimaris]